MDTDIAVDVLRGYEPAIQWLLSESGVDVGLPGFAAMELLQGCHNKRDQRTVLDQIDQYRILWPSSIACDRALRLFARYRLSDGLDLLDAFIASLALELGMSLHGFNEKHYRPIPGLTLVQPYERGAA